MIMKLDATGLIAMINYAERKGKRFKELKEKESLPSNTFGEYASSESKQLSELAIKLTTCFNGTVRTSFF